MQGTNKQIHGTLGLSNLCSHLIVTSMICKDMNMKMTLREMRTTD